MCVERTKIWRLFQPRFILLLATVLNTITQWESDSSTDLITVHRENLRNDLRSCERCFRHQVADCLRFFEQIEEDSEQSLWNLINRYVGRSCTRSNDWFLLKNPRTKIIAKRFRRSQIENYDMEQLKNEFLNTDRLDGLQYCPTQSVGRFVQHWLSTWGTVSQELNVWLYMLTNIEPLLMPYLHEHRFAVPRPYAACGLTLFQAYAGPDLHHYYAADFGVKLRIAKHLLEAALKFTRGFEGFRIYITDLTADNVAYDAASDKLSFLDLDTVLIVDSLAAPHQLSQHKHEHIECADCFAYSPQDMCSHQLSDLNLYASCQFLRENLRGQRSGGFLQPMPPQIQQNYPDFRVLLDQCVDCPSPQCADRFVVVKDLISLIEQILLHSY